MARRKRRGRKDAIRKWVGRIARGGAMLIKSGPITFPAAVALKQGLETKDPLAALDLFVYEASGYSPFVNKSLDTGKLAEVAVRDIALIAIGTVLGHVARRI